MLYGGSVKEVSSMYLIALATSLGLADFFGSTSWLTMASSVLSGTFY